MRAEQAPESWRFRLPLRGPGAIFIVALDCLSAGWMGRSTEWTAVIG